MNSYLLHGVVFSAGRRNLSQFGAESRETVSSASEERDVAGSPGETFCREIFVPCTEEPRNVGQLLFFSNRLLG